MKTCTHCSRRQAKKNFRKRSAVKDGLTSWCKQCLGEHHQRYYQENKKKFRKHTLKCRRRASKQVQKIKDQPCSDCKQRFPSYVMDFDHRDPKLKEFNIGTAVSHGFAWERIEAEIAKCDLVCSNCHRIRTHG